MDERLQRLAKSSPNFGLLFQHEPLLALYGAEAELNVFSNPNASLVQAGQFAEVLAAVLVTRTGLRVEGDSQYHRIIALERVGVLVREVPKDFHQLRQERNQAAHNHLFDTSRALAAVRTCYKLGLWFHNALSGTRSIAQFVPPTDPGATGEVTDPAELAELRQTLEEDERTLAEARTRLTESADELAAERQARAEAEHLMGQLQAAKAEFAAENQRLLAEMQQLRAAHDSAYELARKNPRRVDASARDVIVERAGRPAPLNEVQARTAIDRMLTDAGWRVQDRDAVDTTAEQGVAVREFTLTTGRADYVLYVDGRIVGVIEAKREGEPLGAALVQNDRYAGGVLKEHRLAVWRTDEPFAFRYATTGAETYFLNRLDPDARSRHVFSFHRPETVAYWMKRATEQPGTPTLRAAFRRLPPLETHGLRLAQIDAITGLEQSLAEDRPRALIEMAAGAGKTYTAITETYRLLKHAEAGRVLFLVDRNNLGRQAADEFGRYRTPDDSRKFGEIYNIDRLGPAGLQDSSSVVVCTIQKMYALLKGEQLGEDETVADEAESSSFDTDGYDVAEPVSVIYNKDVPPETFDLIIIDECHRSIYGLWRGVLEYFDAHLVGLTATPKPQTLGFFRRNRVSRYTREEAVIDGVNVDFDLVRLTTDIREDGHVACIEAGTTVEKRDRRTRRKWYEELDDDYQYTGKDIGRSVITQDEIRAVLSEFKQRWRKWFPERAEVPKTLIFAVGEDHAEEVLAQAKEIFGRGEKFATKITYKSRAAGNDPDDLINALREDPRLRIAVTVDMIATGTDVKALECVIFLRSVKSPVLFEQMLGRGARSIEAENLKAVTPDADHAVRKSRFVLLDAVGVTDSPLVDAQPLAPATGRQVSLAKLMDKAGTKSITTDEADTLARRLSRLAQQLTDEESEELSGLADGADLRGIARDLFDATDPERQDRAETAGGPAAARKLVDDALAPLTGNPGLRDRIVQIRRGKDLVIDETTEVSATVREVPPEELAEKNLKGWGDLLRTKRDEITAVEIAMGCGSGEYTPEEAYAALKDLSAQIRRANWTPEILFRAYEDVGRAVRRGGRTAGVADLVSLIRYELGADEELKPYRTAVEERFAAWVLRQEQAGVQFNEAQVWFLERIRNVIANEVGITTDDLSHDPFTERGGSRGFMRAFGGREAARNLLNDLNRELA